MWTPDPQPSRAPLPASNDENANLNASPLLGSDPAYAKPPLIPSIRSHYFSQPREPVPKPVPSPINPVPSYLHRAPSLEAPVLTATQSNFSSPQTPKTLTLQDRFSQRMQTELMPTQPTLEVSRRTERKPGKIFSRSGSQSARALNSSIDLNDSIGKGSTISSIAPTAVLY